MHGSQTISEQPHRQGRSASHAATLMLALFVFAAIPAVIGYNRFGHGLNRLEARLNRFADGFHATLSRELELDL